VGPADAAFRDLERLVRGRRVSSTGVFLFTLQIYLDSGHSDRPDLEIWFEPIWHVRSASGIVTGSGAIERPSAYDDDAEVERASTTIHAASEATKVLVGQTLESLELEPSTHALVAHFSTGLIVATFLDAPGSDSLWVLRDPFRDVAVRGTGLGLALGTLKSVV
jgi:hypothetical protein